MLAAVGAAVVLPVAALVVYGGLLSAFDEAVTSELRVRADDVATDLQAGAPVPAGDRLVTQVLDAEGRVVVPAGAEPLVAADEIDTDRELVMDRPITGIGDQARLLVRPIPAGGPDAALVAVAGSTASVRRAQERLVVVFGVAGPVLVASVAALAWLLTGSALRPVARMTRRAATLSLREPEARLPQPAGRDEIAELARTLNTMLDRIAGMVAHERALVDDASHELRSPLAVLRSELELARLGLREEPDPERIRAMLDSALEETDRLVALTEHLLVLARADAGRLVGAPEPVVLAEAADHIVRGLAAPDVEITLDLDAVVLADPTAVERLLSNLIVNATRWADSRVLVTAAAAGDEGDGDGRNGRDGGDGGDGTVVIVVADDGAGFDPQLLERAFDRFSRADRTRNRRGGTGLGLAIAAAITGALGGRIAARNGPPLGGAVVEVRLPAAGPGSGG